MAELHNALTGYPKLQEAFRRAIGETSPAFTGIERAGETLTPVLDLWAIPEWALLRGEVIYSRYFSVGPQAGLFSSIELVNPTGSGVLCTVLELMAGGNIFQVGIDTGVALGVVATNRGIANDARWPNLGEVSRCSLVSGNLAAGVALPQDQVAAATRTTRPYIVQPGKKLFMSTIAVNQTLQLGILFTERPLLAGENAI